MARYQTDPLYDPRPRRSNRGMRQELEQERRMRGSWNDGSPERESTTDERRTAEEPWPYTPYASAPVPGTPGWHPPHLEDRNSGPSRSQSNEWDWHDRSFRDRVGDAIASWLGDDDALRRRQADFTGVGPKGYRRPDARIEENLHEVLTDDARLDASDIHVTVKEGEVTLAGAVATRAEKRRAEDCADSVAGVGHVQNNLRVRNR